MSDSQKRFRRICRALVRQSIILLVYVIRFCYQLSSVSHGLLLQSWALWIITCLFSAANIPTERRESIKKCKESLIEYIMNCLLGNFEHSSECENDNLEVTQFPLIMRPLFFRSLKINRLQSETEPVRSHTHYYTQTPSCNSFYHPVADLRLLVWKKLRLKPLDNTEKLNTLRLFYQVANSNQ